MPPPPLPPSLGTSSGSADDFNSTWNMSMSWTPLDSSLNSSGASSSSYANQSTPHSPPHFERKGSSAVAPIEYNEHLHSNSATLGAEDVDHRTLQLPPAFDFGAKLGLSKDKSRQLVDIDHRNLISLTGSPGGAEKVKYFTTSVSNLLGLVWYFINIPYSPFQDFTGGDVDYRIVPNPNDEGIMAPPGNNYAKSKTSSPLKSNASTSEYKYIIFQPPITYVIPQIGSSSESDRVDGAARYDPADMVIDMDMSDDDLDESLRGKH